MAWLPELTYAGQAGVRMAYGVLLLATLLWALPHGRRFFVSERWGGYAESSPWRDVLHSPTAYPFVMGIWILCAVLLASGRGVVWAALANLVLCRHYFVAMRWRGVLRGMGAPGFMTYWLGGAIFLLEGTTHFVPSVRTLALFVIQVDFALIMASAGLYKISAGFARNEGMELGLANPAWGYWWRRYMTLAPSHRFLWVLNQLAWSTELAAAVLLLCPPTRTLGGLLIIASFLFIATQIRLAFLCETVMACGMLYFAPGSLPDRVVMSLVSSAGTVANPEAFVPHAWVTVGSTVTLWGYLMLLPLVHAALFYNLYAQRPLPGRLQRALERYANFFGIIIWRVFSSDLVNFFVRIFRQNRHTGERVLLSRYGIAGGLRFSHVAESIAVTSVFSTLKYYPTNRALFEGRLLRYARTLTVGADDVLVFEYVSLRKTSTRFEPVPVAEYGVDRRGTIHHRVLSSEVSVHAAHPGSPLYEGVTPGSYAPLNAAGGKDWR